jgi:hypothetical protein
MQSNAAGFRTTKLRLQSDVSYDRMLVTVCQEPQNSLTSPFLLKQNSEFSVWRELIPVDNSKHVRCKAPICGAEFTALKRLTKTISPEIHRIL